MHIWYQIMIEDYENANLIVCGDFNAQPDSLAYKYLKEEAGFKSAFLEVNGKEPEVTFPSGLQASTMDTDP